MFTPIALNDCPGLIDLMLTCDDRVASFSIDGVQCMSERVGDHATFEAVSPEFGFSVVVPGWYAGEHGAPAHVAIVGEAQACTDWLPLDSANKLALIWHLPLSPVDRMLCRLSI